jgi:type I restriction enzyme R subunit
MLQAIEDGYLAACEILKRNVNIDEQIISFDEVMRHNPRNAITGQPITTIEELKELYEKTDYESRLLLPDRIFAMCKDLFDALLKSGTIEQKTIIFCVRDIHAELVSKELNNMYNDYCKLQGKKPAQHFAFKCTSESGGSELIADMKGMNTDYFIATTVDLLSTGIDIPAVRNIVFFKYVKSPISFHQMVGRGTRLADNKMMFTIYDYTNATRLFGNDFKSRPTPSAGDGGGGGGEKPVIIEADGFEVEVSPDGQYVVSEVGGQIKRITIEDYKKGIAQKLLSNINSFEDFRNKWIMPQERKEMLDNLLQSGYSAEILRQVKDMSDYDLFDVLIEIAFGNTAKNKMQRVLDFQAKERNWLSSLHQETREVIIAIVNQFAVCGTDCIENSELFKVYDVMKAGGMKALNKNGNAKVLLLEAKLRLFAA